MWLNIKSGGSPDHFLPHKFIERSFEHWENSTKQLLNAGGGHQTPRKTAHPLWKEVGHTHKKTKRETKELGMETCPGEGNLKEKFPNIRKPSHWQVCGEFWNLRGQHNQEEKRKNNPQNTHLTTTPSGELAQMLVPASSNGGWTGLGLNALGIIWGT